MLAIDQIRTDTVPIDGPLRSGHSPFNNKGLIHPQSGEWVPTTLSLKDLHAYGRPGLTQALGGVLAECASLCLESQGHGREILIDVVGADVPDEYIIRRKNITQRIRNAHNDTNRTTDHGACGIAILIAEDITELVVQNSSATNNGYDYWLGETNNIDDNFLAAGVRLEVSGIRNGTSAEVKARAEDKLNRDTVDEDAPSDFYVIVVEFSAPVARVESA